MSIHGLRFYEKEGLITPKRRGKNRVYSEDDKMWIEFLRHLKDTGMSVQDMKNYTDLRKQENPPMTDLLGILVSHREKVKAQLDFLQHNLTVLDKKIDLYKQEIDESEGKDLFDNFVENYQENHE